MKAIFLTASLLFSAYTQGCDTQQATTMYSDWKLIETRGGMAGNQTIKPSQLTVLSLTTDGSYTVSENKAAVKSGTFVLEATNSIFTGNEVAAIVFDNTDVQLIELGPDTLKLTENHPEPYARTYVRLKW